MPRTPDRFPGAFEEDVEVILVENSSAPSVPGAFNYDGTSFRMRDADGVFNPRSAASFDDILLDELGRIVYVGDGEFVLRG